jgi:hypothetical protein
MNGLREWPAKVQMEPIVFGAFHGLRARSVEFLQVKTLGPSRPDERHDRTRRFYEHMGLRPLEENNPSKLEPRSRPCARCCQP